MLSLKGFNFRKAEIPPVNTLEEKWKIINI
jgi:hypothetical protein